MERFKVTSKRPHKTGGGQADGGRSKLPFRSVNKPGKPGYKPGMQRHHLLPIQLVSGRHFSRLFELIGRERIGFDDFRFNGLLLPAMEKAAIVLGLPLHRGPHRQYNEVVAARVSQIEGDWNRKRKIDEELAGEEVLMRMRLLQAALRRSLLQPASRRIKLNKHDPFQQSVDFAALDAMADTIWSGTGSDAEAEG